MKFRMQKYNRKKCIFIKLINSNFVILRDINYKNLNANIAIMQVCGQYFSCKNSTMKERKARKF